MVERRLWFKQSAARVTKRIVTRGGVGRCYKESVLLALVIVAY